MDSITKKCNYCRKTKNVSGFGKYRKSKDGLRNFCKECRKKIETKYRDGNILRCREWGIKNPERKRAGALRWNAENPLRAAKNKLRWKLENLEKTREIKRAWKNRNTEKTNAWRRAHYQENHEAETARRRKWLECNPGKIAEYNNARRARKNSVGGRVLPDEWKKMCDYYGNKCLRCGRDDVKLTQDHVIPLKLGGQNAIENIQPLCKSCNSSKNSNYIDYRKSEPKDKRK